MIKIENTETYGWEAAIRGMRNPYESWDKSDSYYCTDCGCENCRYDKVGTVANSCSTMHKIHAKEFTLEDFSCEHLDHDNCILLKEIIARLNRYRNIFISGGIVEYPDDGRKVFKSKDKDIWRKMIQLLPSSYNQRRTIQLNYQVLRNIYHARRNHELDCWREFCRWIENLPYSELITGGYRNG